MLWPPVVCIAYRGLPVLGSFRQLPCCLAAAVLVWPGRGWAYNCTSLLSMLPHDVVATHRVGRGRNEERENAEVLPGAELL